MIKSCCQHESDGLGDTQGCCSQPLEVTVVATGVEGYRGPSVPLTELRTGQLGVVRAIELDARDSSMLRAMGLRVNARVRICRLGEPCIIELMGGSAASVDATQSCPRGAACTCRIGLSRPLAQRVMVGVG